MAVTGVPDPDTWESFSDKYLLPEAIFYGKRLISLKRLWELAVRRTTVLDSSLAYKAVFDEYCDGIHKGTGLDDEFTNWDAGWAAGMFLALNLVRANFNLPIPAPPKPPTVAEPTAHPGKELV